MAKITVVYKGYTAPECRVVDPICPVFLPTNSYVDGAGMAGTVYDTNVAGMGNFDQKSFIANLCIPFPGAVKYLNMAAVDGQVELEVTDYKEVLFFKELKAQLEGKIYEGTADSAWEITIDEGEAAASGEEPVEE